MEFEAKKLLMERLDKNLIDHTRELSDRKHIQIADVYRLQGLAEVHCYLKTAHEFNAAEVEALLHFADPLNVATAAGRKTPMNTASPSATFFGKRRRRSISRPPSRNRPRNYLCGNSFKPPCRKSASKRFPKNSAEAAIPADRLSSPHSRR